MVFVSKTPLGSTKSVTFYESMMRMCHNSSAWKREENQVQSTKNGTAHDATIEIRIQVVHTINAD